MLRGLATILVLWTVVAFAAAFVVGQWFQATKTDWELWTKEAGWDEWDPEEDETDPAYDLYDQEKEVR